MKAEPIPTRSRQLVKDREQRRCLRCSGPGVECHHRRSRWVRDEHTHCPCNLVSLCVTCHRWAHAQPAAARDDGFIVSRHREPRPIPVVSIQGVVRLDCDGNYERRQQ